MKNQIILNDLNYIFKNFDKKENFYNSSILITGCAGFLGFYFLHFFSYFFEQLNIKSIIGLDNFKLGRPIWLDKLPNRNKIKIHSFDIAKDNLSKIKNADEADFVIHMASIASPSFYRIYPLETLDANVWGLRKLLDYYKRKSLKGFLFFSSSEIFGDPSRENIPTPEDYRGNVSCLGPRACYDEAKRFGETLCYVFSKQFGSPIVIVRPFNNYGPGMKLEDKRVPADFAKAVFENKDLVIHSDGAPRRTFCYIADAFLGYLKALAYGSFEYFNIGASKPELSIKELAEIYLENGRKIAGYTGSIKFKKSLDKEYLTDNPQRRCPDITKAKNLLNYNPAIGINEGVRRFLEFVKISGGEL
ncbi:MAG: NAD-dependent epimerase/dehydratase family protein [Armatimonadetes bacterium]|nr:NAD-dependent epimerase/dehydratase family protein [Armatimonadota bacterium]